jgi:hypothetical protein
MGLDPSAAQNTRGVVDIPIPDFSGQRAGAEALDNVGKAMLEFGNKLQKEKEDHELVKADADMRVRMDKARQVIELDPETPDAAIPQRWKQESELIIKEVGGGISSSRARELWEIRARGVQGEGDVWSQNLLRKRQVDKVGGAYITMASEAEEMAGDPSISPETYASKLDGLRALTAQHLAGGFIGDEEAAKRVALLESYAVKDVKMRWSAGVLAVARTGDFDGAEKMIAGAKGLSVAERESALSSVGRERSLQEKEKADNQRAMGNAMEVDILDGKVTRSQIDEAAALGTINPNDAPVLIRALRAEDDRLKAAAERAKLSAAERKAFDERSKNVKFIFDAMANTPATTARFLAGPDGWGEEYRNYYTMLNDDDQRAVERKLSDMKISGTTTPAVNSVYGALLDEAKRVVPEWQLSSDANPKNLNENSLPFRGVLQSVAESLSKDKGGTPLTVDEARDAVARALRSYQPDNFMNLPTNQRDVYLENPGAASFKTEAGIMATDGGSRFAYDEGANIRNEIRSEFIRTKRREPTKAELDAEYARVVAD